MIGWTESKKSGKVKSIFKVYYGTIPHDELGNIAYALVTVSHTDDPERVSGPDHLIIPGNPKHYNGILLRQLPLEPNFPDSDIDPKPKAIGTLSVDCKKISGKLSLRTDKHGIVFVNMQGLESRPNEDQINFVTLVSRLEIPDPTI